ncbi:hypothetical protein ACLMJK_000608 [Lecanora helva]
MSLGADIGDDLQDKYWTLLLETQRHVNYHFVEDLYYQDEVEQERGRAALLEFSTERTPAKATTFASSDELKAHLDAAASEDPSTDPRRRLYLLEDIGRNYVEIFGSRLRIPPAFFSSQYSNPSFSIPVVDPASLDQNPSRYFQLKYRQIHTVLEEDKSDYQIGLYYDMDSNVLRQLQLLDENDSIEYSKHHLSYWGNRIGDGSWVEAAVILLDPLITKLSIVKKYARNGEHIVRLDHPRRQPKQTPYANYQSLSPLSHDPEEWNFQLQAPGLLSLFDDLLYIHSRSNNAEITDEPLSATHTCRSLVRCTWEAYLASRTSEYHSNLDKILFKNPVTNASSWVQTWDTAWRADVFRRLFSTRLGIDEAVVKDIGSNLKALGVDYSGTKISEYEAQQWRSLQNSGTNLINVYATFIDAYLQENSIQESRTSNNQARSVGRLTSLATVLVPFSIVAGMFSMGGDFLAGQSHFWVFWAVTIPIVATLGILFYVQSRWAVYVEICKKCYLSVQGWTQGMWCRLLRKRHQDDPEETSMTEENGRTATRLSRTSTSRSQKMHFKYPPHRPMTMSRFRAEQNSVDREGGMNSARMDLEMSTHYVEEID